VGVVKEVSERLELHDQVFAAVFDKLRQDRYPSSQQLDLLETYLVGHERDELVQILLDKVRQDRYPSMAMVRRLIRLTS
jgi:hypothetical protein